MVPREAGSLRRRRAVRRLQLRSILCSSRSPSSFGDAECSSQRVMEGAMKHHEARAGGRLRSSGWCSSDRWLGALSHRRQCGHRLIGGAVRWRRGALERARSLAASDCDAAQAVWAADHRTMTPRPASHRSAQHAPIPPLMQTTMFRTPRWLPMSAGGARRCCVPWLVATPRRRNQARATPRAPALGASRKPHATAATLTAPAEIAAK